MALWSAVTVLVAHPEPKSQPATANKTNFFIARNIDLCAMIAPGKEHSNDAHRNGAPKAFSGRPLEPSLLRSGNSATVGSAHSYSEH